MSTRDHKTTAEIYKTRTGWRFRIIARNGEIVASSESYTRKASAKRGACRVYPNAHQQVRE